MEWILYLILFWVLVIGYSVVKDLFKNNDELLDSINDKIFGYSKLHIQYYGLMIITIITISFGSGLIPLPSVGSSSSNIDTELCKCFKDTDYYLSNQNYCDSKINDFLGFDHNDGEYHKNPNHLSKYRQLESYCK